MRFIMIRNILSCLILLPILNITNISTNKGIDKTLTLKIVTQCSTYYKGDLINISVQISNRGNSDKLIPLVMIPEDYWLKFEIYDGENKKLRYTGPKYKVRHVNEKLLLLPDHFYGKKIEITNLYSGLLKLGKYKIRAVYGIPPVDNYIFIGPIYSNIINIEVIK
ncbi:MAG: hypothetical protein P8078_12995 [bacterium]